MNDLERSLALLGRELDVPDAPDVVPAVRERLRLAQDRQRPRSRRRWALAVAIAVLVLLGATLAIPDARSAFLRIFDVGGERIHLVEELPEVEALGDLELVLGQRVTLAEARATAGFDLRELDEAPDRVYLGDRGTVWFLYGTPSNVRLLVAQTPRLRLDAPAILKKLAGMETEVEAVRVNGAEGVFLSGEPHFAFLLDEEGRVVDASARLAEDVLIWDEGGIAYRLEADFDRERALELARELMR